MSLTMRRMRPQEDYPMCAGRCGEQFDMETFPYSLADEYGNHTCEECVAADRAETGPFVPCPTCRGEGTLPDAECPRCDGTAHVHVDSLPAEEPDHG